MTSTRSGIPLLVDLPIIGRLFGVTKRQETKRDLLILITPHIIDPGQDRPDDQQSGDRHHAKHPFSHRARRPRGGGRHQLRYAPAHGDAPRGAGTPPDVVIDTPLVNTQINIGDSIFVRVLATGGNALQSLELTALAITGDKDLGTYAETPRYKTATVDASRRDARHDDPPVPAADRPRNTTLDSIIIQAILTDSRASRTRRASRRSSCPVRR